MSSVRRPFRHDQPGQPVRSLLGVSLQIQPLRQLNLRDQQEDRRGDDAPAGFQPGRPGAALGLQSSFSLPQTRPPASIDEALAQPCAAFTFAGGDPAKLHGFACSGRGDREPDLFFERISGPVSCAPMITGAFDHTSAAAFEISSAFGKWPSGSSWRGVCPAPRR
jgi:hypothetical protein